MRVQHVFAAVCIASLLCSCGRDYGEPAPSDPAPSDVACMAPPLIELDSIPDDPGLDGGDPDKVAIFEVDGHKMIGKFVRDRTAAEGGLKLWQEIMLRVPENQLRDLVQLDIYLDTDPVAYFNRTGQVNTNRYGLKIGFSTRSFELNDPDPCAPLEPHRGTFDWSLVHEFGHLRGWVDRSWDAFLETFPDVRGDGEGYPADGSPVLTGDFVTSYAERADGDEDYAETWTTFVMLDELPAPSTDEPLALQKVRWVASQPGLKELRQAIRITEPGGGNVTLDPAPRLRDRLVIEEIVIPTWLHGTWRGTVPATVDDPSYEQEFTFTANTIVEAWIVDGERVMQRDFAALKQAGSLIHFEIVDNGEAALFGYHASIFPETPVLEDSFVNMGETALWTTLDGQNDFPLARVVAP